MTRPALHPALSHGLTLRQTVHLRRRRGWFRTFRINGRLIGVRIFGWCFDWGRWP